ncbi:HAD family hydrolase [Gloeothece verrucosa]|uniref:HAD-superfamily hydrolase, subfamily IA, variant 3 n=1 Tax=Gloeothece verrucosa (strain PCC 7822) TaxID=497965 RepID=E0U9P2_GLOV7|nr:HAD family phosphatase [Gloeothece verrucosa]ADN13843.1 HAD-superfamily hydrolase, subfamily IA, variant 3 [Gloeothece verrucosa PCC 7822]
MLKVILFDFNGVIINDEAIHLDLIEEILLGENLRPSLAEFQQICLGRSDRACLRDILARRGRVISDEYLNKLIESKAQKYRQRLEKFSELPIYPEIKGFLPKLQDKGLKIGLVTGALRSEVNLVLERAEIAHYFSVIVAGDEIKASKPQPDGYLLAVERFNRLDFNLQLQPSECLVIEDTPAGIQAAKKAGMQVVGIANTYPFHFMQRMANWAIDYLADLELERVEEILA